MLVFSSNLKSHIPLVCVVTKYMRVLFFGGMIKHFMDCHPSFSNINQLSTIRNDSFIHLQVSIYLFFGDLFNLNGKRFDSGSDSGTLGSRPHS